jgi:hypothetical protein
VADDAPWTDWGSALVVFYLSRDGETLPPEDDGITVGAMATLEELLEQIKTLPLSLALVEHGPDEDHAEDDAQQRYFERRPFGAGGSCCAGAVRTAGPTTGHGRCRG